MNSIQSVIPIVGRVLFALLFLGAAPRHFTAEGISHAAELGVPFAQILVPASGVLAIAGALSVATGFQARFGACGLVLFLLPVTLWMHQFWNVTDPALRHTQFAMFGKNVALIGAALYMAAL